MTVAWLNVHDGPPDKKSEYSQYGVTTLMAAQFFEVKSIRVLPPSSIAYALHQLKLKTGASPTIAQTRKLGELIEARRVISADCREADHKCVLTIRVLNVATGRASRKLSVSGPDWINVATNALNIALKELAIVPTMEERARMAHLPTRSPEALDLYSRAMDKYSATNLFSDAEPLFRKSVSADPGFTTPLTTLAVNLIMGRDSLDEAEDLAQRAVKIRPEYPAPHYALGIVYEVKGMNHLAQDELREAVRLNPDDPDNFIRLGEIYGRMDKLDDAIAAWKLAASLARYDPQPYAALGTAFAMQGKREDALAQLQLAEHFNFAEGPSVDQRLANAYEALKDAPRYVEHAEKFISTAKKMGFQSPMIAEEEKEIAHWKPHLEPHFVTAPRPRSYSPDELNAALHARLTPGEFQSITNPLAGTPEMAKWARKLTAGATNSQQKARQLFEGLTHHIDRGNFIGKRTAKKTFAVWNQPDIDLTCLDYSFLYVALARDVGLDAYFTIVKRDCYGRLVMHVCACVFIDGKALLVDPAYIWFGAPHQEFAPQDDFQTIAGYLCQLPGLENQRLSVKLLPESALPHFNYAMTLSGFKRLSEARKELAAGLAIEPDSPMAFMAQGAVEGNSQKLDVSAKFLRKALDMEPELDDARYGLAKVLDAQGNSAEAREQFRKYLEGHTDPAKADEAIKAIAQINETLAGSQ